MFDKDSYLGMVNTLISVLDELPWEKLAQASKKGYDAFIKEGFSPDQSIELLKNTKLS